MSIATKLAKLKTIKQDIKSALEEKGQTPSNVFSTYANNIRAIETGGSSVDTSQEDGLITRTLTSYSNDRVSSIGKYAFYAYSSLTNVELPNITSIARYAFSNTSLANVELPNITSIEEYAFFNCRELKNVDFPKVTKISSSVFANCYLLIKLFISQTDKVCTLSDTSAFNYCYHITGETHPYFNPNGLKDGYIYVPHTLLTQYKAATNWVQFKSQIIGWGDFASGDILPNYADYNNYKTCKWYANKELTQPVYEITMIASGKFVVDSGSETITTAGRYYCKLD